MYFFIHHDVIFHKRHFFPVGMQETLQQRRRFQRTAEIDACAASSVRWQGYVQGCPSLYKVWLRHWLPYLHDLPARWTKRWNRSMRHNSTFCSG